MITSTSARFIKIIGCGFLMTVSGASAQGADNSGANGISVTRGPRGTNIMMTAADGSAVAVHQTSGRVLQPHTINVTGSSSAVAMWTEAAGGANRTMYSFTTDGQHFSRALEASGRLRLRFADFDPLAAMPEVPADLSTDQADQAADQQSPYIVQYFIPPLEAMQNQVRAVGATTAIILPDEAQIVLMTAAQRDQVAALPFVRWVGVYEPAYRLDESLLPLIAESVQSMPVQRYSMMVFQRGPTQQQAVADRITAMGGTVQTITPEGFRMQAFLNGQQLVAVAHMNEIHFIDPMGEAGIDMDIARQIGGAVPLLSGLGFTGQGVRGEVMDNGCLTSHTAFQAPALLVHGIPASNQSHGTSTTGIVFGNGNSNAAGTGMLPNREQGIFAQYTMLTSIGGTVSRYNHTSELVNPVGPYRAVFQSNSWGNALTSAYTTLSAEFDDIIFDFDILICQSQSNNGNTLSRPEAWAKNAVSIGGVSHVNTMARNDDSWTSASVGPAADGRIKPDLAHFYDNVLCPTNTTTTAYTTTFNGTSSATPIVSGHFGLLFQMWHLSVFPGFGGGATVFASRPHAATAKAMMINSAFRYNWLAGGSNATLTRVRQGWGMPDLAKLYNDRLKTFIVNETDLLTAGSSKTYQITVNAGEPELRVTMAYSDPQGNPAAPTQHRVNDLTLKVTSPASVVYWGNNGLSAGNFSTSGGVANIKDTVENVFLQSPPAGTWTVQVFGDSIVQDSHVETPAMDADYALVVAGGLPIPLCPEDVTGNGVVDIDDLLGVINAWGACVGCAADVTGNGMVDIDDLLAVINGWGPC